jgi:hypothetical protein
VLSRAFPLVLLGRGAPIGGEDASLPRRKGEVRHCPNFIPVVSQIWQASCTDEKTVPSSSVRMDETNTSTANRPPCL